MEEENLEKPNEYETLKHGFFSDAKEIEVYKESEIGETRIIRDEEGRFIPGVSGNPGGRPKDTEADKIKKKATKEIIKEYKEALGEALPLIKPVILAKALEGDMTAIKEIHDRVMDKSRQNVGLDGGGEGLAIQFAEVFKKE